MGFIVTASRLNPEIVFLLFAGRTFSPRPFASVMGEGNSLNLEYSNDGFLVEKRNFFFFWFQSVCVIQYLSEKQALFFSCGSHSGVLLSF